MEAYAPQWLQFSIGKDDQYVRLAQLRRVSEIYYDNAQALIRQSVPQEHCFQLSRGTAAEEWKDCWEFLGLEGDLTKSTAEWSRQYNAFGHRGVDNYR